MHEGQNIYSKRLTNAETALAMQTLLNNALKGDNLDKVIYDRPFTDLANL